MAKAFGILVKTFGKQYGVAAWSVVGTFDLNVTNKFRANSIYKTGVAEVRHKMLSSFSEICQRSSIEELVQSRVRESGTAVSDAILREAVRAEEAFWENDELETGWGEERSLWDSCAISFCFGDEFRSQFSRALREDGLQGDSSRLWSGIDRVASSLDDEGQEGSEQDGLVRCQQDIMASLVLASLLGAEDFSQIIGYEVEGTLPPIVRKQVAECGAKCCCRLQPIVPTGISPWNYLTGWGEAIALSRNAVARVGRDERWCKEDGFVPVMVACKETSGKHCEIAFGNSAWAVTDLESTNGTLVIHPNGTKRFVSNESVELSMGDIICVAPCSLDATTYDEENLYWAPGREGVCFRFELG